MAESARRVAELLHEAGNAHHVVYRIVDGADDDWHSWYSTWLLELSELPQILGRVPVRSELTWLLVQLDRDYTAQEPEDRWEDWYAERLLGHFSG
jgi:hypothetical protein